MEDGNSLSSSDAGQPPGSHIHGHGGGRCRKKKKIVKRKLGLGPDDVDYLQQSTSGAVR